MTPLTSIPCTASRRVERTWWPARATCAAGTRSAARCSSARCRARRGLPPLGAVGVRWTMRRATFAAPPSGYSELTSAPFHGHFTASQYAAQTADASKKASVEATLNREGFVDGYGDAWVSTSTGHVLVEWVLAFSGGRGAQHWLIAAETGDKSDPTYSHADTMSGIDPYYGEHVVDAANKTAGDDLSVSKGSAGFLVLVASASDNNLATATEQAKAQHDSAPESTIPSSHWPDTQSNSAAFDTGRVTAYVLVAALILAVIAVVLGLILPRRQRPLAPAARGRL